MPIAEQARDIALALTRRPSVTATRDEASFAPWLAYLLDGGGIDIRIVPLPGDRLGRASVFALARGAGDAVAVLINTQSGSAKMRGFCKPRILKAAA